MSLLYVDSSVLVSMALGDQRGLQALAILGSRDSCTSELSSVECQGGLSINYSEAPSGLPVAEQVLNTLLGRMQVIQVTSAVLRQARTLVRRYRTGIGLRTLHALHIASCAEVQAQLGAGTIEYITADRRQHNAFTSEGFSGALLP
jgi:uncharacterized protein with PIN domain